MNCQGYDCTCASFTCPVYREYCRSVFRASAGAYWLGILALAFALAAPSALTAAVRLAGDSNPAWATPLNIEHAIQQLAGKY